MPTSSPNMNLQPNCFIMFEKRPCSQISEAPCTMILTLDDTNMTYSSSVMNIFDDLWLIYVL